MRCVSLAALLLALTAAGRAENWSRFRGPNGAGVSSETGLPEKWSKTENVRWKADLPARGVSSPVVHNGRVYVTCSSGRQDDRLHTLAFDAATGKQLWHRQLAATGGTNCHPMTCMAAPTPAADDSGVYALFATGDLAAFDADGTLRWYRSLVGDYPKITNQVGMAASPVLYKDRLIVPMDNDGESFVAALDAKTGANVWKVERKRDINWVTPVIRETGGTAELLLPLGSDLIAYNADTGERLWTHPGGGAGIPSPSVAGGLIYAPSRGLVALKPEGGKAQEVWQSPKIQTGMSSPIVYKGVVYGASPNGVLTAADAAKGTVLWQERYKGKAHASPVAGDGKVYVTNEAGTVTVFKAGNGKEGEILSVNELGDETLGTPAISGGCLYIRTKSSLYCIGGPKPAN
jgi:outer membrane protein assembly factor BamB